MHKQYRFLIFFLIIIIFSCIDQNKKDIDDLRYNIDRTLNQLSELENNPDFQKSPMHLFASNCNVLANKIIDELNYNQTDTKQITINMNAFKMELINHNISDSLIKTYENLLTINKVTKKTKKELEKNILRAQYLFTDEMLRAIQRIQNQEEVLPYIIPVNTIIKGNETMDAFIILPDPKNTMLVFIAPDSLKYDSRRKNFLYVSGIANDLTDSILVEAVVKQVDNQEEHIFLKEYYNVQNIK